ALATTRIDVQVWPLRERGGGSRLDPGTAPAIPPPVLPARSVQVALPDPTWPMSDSSVALVEAPRSRTLFLLGVGPGARGARLDPIGTLPEAPARPIGAFQIIGAIVDPSGVHRERTMVAANGGGRPVRVRPGSPMERRWSRAIGPMRSAAG
ncbi:MAG: hypothetical protein L3K08_00380, partial [Thermoplasmata archaeon]|nr:hypothetical protein [Thermoplasmata archaeon]